MASLGDYHKRIDERRDEIIALLRALIAIPSVLGEAKEGAPFGKATNEVYRDFLDRARADGFDVLDVDGWGGHAEWLGTQTDAAGEIVGPAAKTLGIPVHLDVVPAGGGWDFDPFSGEVVDDRVYGRGASDDKGPVVAVYEAMKALKDSGFVPQKNIRLIIGLDEETGWFGMDKYLAVAGLPDFGFSPDGDFPAVNGEMGILEFELAKKLEKTKEKGVVLRSIEGGTAANVVPDYARAIILDEVNKDFGRVKEKLAAFRNETGYSLSGKGVGKAFEIVAHGKSAHGARPGDGLNAVSILLKFLGELEIANESIREFVDFYNARIGFEIHGESIGARLEDAPSGKLIFNVGKIGMDAEAVIVTINVRYPVTSTDDAVYDAMMPLIHRHDLGVVKVSHKPPIYLPEDDPLIETLVAVYREQTGDVNAKPFVVGGGSYARAIPNAVAYGPTFPGGPNVLHQANEYITIDELMKITHIYAETILRLTADF